MTDTPQQVQEPGEHTPGSAATPPAGAKAPAGGPLPTDPALAGEDVVEEALAGDVDELVAALAQRDDYLALAQRTQADFENYRKRVAREARAAQDRGAATLARELLPALDNLDRALEAADEGDPLLDGVRLVRAELAAGLARVGIESFSPIGEVFDPSVHEAVATAPQEPGGSESGVVVEVYQLGYRLGDTVIRPARVVVAA